MIDVVGVFQDLVTGFLQMIIDFVMFIISLVLLPIEAIISTFIPDYVELTSYINDFLVYASHYLGYCLDSFGFYGPTVILLIGYLMFRLTLPLQVWIVKVAIRWFNALKV